MENMEPVKRLADISEYVFRELGMRGLQRRCIEGSALLLKVLHGTGFPDAYPLTVSVLICNEAFLKHGPPTDEASEKTFNDAGCIGMSIGMGSGETLTGEEAWDGHLVIVAPKALGERHAVIDLTIVQLDKPEWDAPMDPVLLVVGDDFLTGKSESKFPRNDLTMYYQARPNDRTYRDDGNLLAITGLDQAAAPVIEDMKRAGIVV